jgi:uncharacterized protein YdaU (DUF1376 family)
MSKKRWFRFHVEHWRAGTIGLTPREIAAYITILVELYDNEGIVALDVDRMAHYCSMRPTSFRKAVDKLVKRKKLSLEEGFLMSKAVEEEIRWRSKLDQKSIKSRSKVGKRSNENNAIFQKLTLIENRDKDIYSTIEGSRPPEPSKAMLDAAENSPAVARYLARRRLQ